MPPSISRPDQTRPLHHLRCPPTRHRPPWTRSKREKPRAAGHAADLCTLHVHYDASRLHLRRRRTDAIGIKAVRLSLLVLVGFFSPYSLPAASCLLPSEIRVSEIHANAWSPTLRRQCKDSIDWRRYSTAGLRRRPPSPSPPRWSVASWHPVPEQQAARALYSASSMCENCSRPLVSVQLAARRLRLWFIDRAKIKARRQVQITFCACLPATSLRRSAGGRHHLHHRASLANFPWKDTIYTTK